MSDGNPRVANRMFFVADGDASGDASKRHKTRLSAPRKTSESEIARPQSQSARGRTDLPAVSHFAEVQIS